MCRSSARAARLIFSPLSHRRRARLKASRGVVLILGVVTLVPFADPGIILAGARHGGYGHPPLYPKVFEWRVDTEVMQYLGLQQFGGRDGVDQRVMGCVVRQPVAQAAVSQPEIGRASCRERV